MNNLLPSVCQLCKRNEDLCNSHIIPEFLYSELYDDKHRAIAVTSEPGEREKYIQKGLREYLLCQTCETELSKYEGYSAKILKLIPEKLTVAIKGGYAGFIIENVEYSSFKLFQLSLLWRSSVSTELAFSQVNLGKHQEIIRSLVVEKKPGEFFQYGCVLIIVPNAKTLDKMIWSPVRERIDGHICYRFITGELFWYFFVSSHRPSKTIQDLYLRRDGILPIGIAPWSEKDILANLGSLIREKWLKSHS